MLRLTMLERQPSSRTHVHRASISSHAGKQALFERSGSRAQVASFSASSSSKDKKSVTPNSSVSRAFQVSLAAQAVKHGGHTTLDGPGTFSYFSSKSHFKRHLQSNSLGNMTVF